MNFIQFCEHIESIPEDSYTTLYQLSIKIGDIKTTIFVGAVTDSSYQVNTMYAPFIQGLSEFHKKSAIGNIKTSNAIYGDDWVFVSSRFQAYLDLILSFFTIHYDRIISILI